MIDLFLLILGTAMLTIGSLLGKDHKSLWLGIVVLFNVIFDGLTEKSKTWLWTIIGTGCFLYGLFGMFSLINPGG